MVKKRIVPCLDVQGNRTVKGRHFTNLKDAGCPLELAQRYQNDGADEMVFLDISASIEQRATLVQLVEQIAEGLSIPFSVGGGVATSRDVEKLLLAGADKVCVNSAAVRRPALVDELARNFGSQCVVAAVDARMVEGHWMVFSHSARQAAQRRAFDWLHELQERGAGEILLTSIENDGAKSGFALGLYAPAAHMLGIPVIASGGAGASQHFVDLFRETACSAALAAGIFHYATLGISALKQCLHNKGIPVRWN